MTWIPCYMCGQFPCCCWSRKLLQQMPTEPMWHQQLQHPDPNFRITELEKRVAELEKKLSARPSRRTKKERAR